MIEYIVFDLGNVIVRFNPYLNLKEFIRETGADENLIFSFFSSQTERQFTEGHISTAEFFLTMKKELNISVSLDYFDRIYSDIFSPDFQVWDIISALKHLYPLALLSNTNELHFKHIYKTYPIVRELTPHILSFKEGCQKPDKRIFDILLERIGKTPDQVLFIDDTEENIRAAQKHGIHAILHTDAHTLQKGLKAHDITCAL